MWRMALLLRRKKRFDQTLHVVVSFSFVLVNSLNNKERILEKLWIKIGAKR